MAGLRPKISAVIPTLGASPHLETCLRALRSDGGEELEIVLVDQSPKPLDLPEELTDQVIRPGKNLGFAEATNRGIAASKAPLVATINDDLVIHPNWCARLEQVLAGNPRAAAVQGLQTRLGNEREIDGCGIALDHWWQACQLGSEEPANLWSDPETTEIFGVSATAALYRRSALERVALPQPRLLRLAGLPSGRRGPRFFDSSLGSYYEDVDLACRLRAAGFRAYRAPGARADHAGSATGNRRPLKRLTQLRGNRYAVVARLLGRTLWLNLPRMLERDTRDLVRACLRGQFTNAAAILLGLVRAIWLGPRYVHFGPPSVPLEQIRRFRPERAR
ncbi:MAG: glycosyltransferase family 2 protein [Deltaproteobacteria bacterium]|nr:glycosyltransferase family 2 protein [Deltaproteobacteria bacterium]